jgi:hypothetical protein
MVAVTFFLDDSSALELTPLAALADHRLRPAGHPRRSREKRGAWSATWASCAAGASRASERPKKLR